MSLKRRAALAGILSLAVACSSASTSVTHVWSAEVRPPMKSVVVFAGQLDEVNRRLVEDGLVTELRKHGVDARQGYAAFPSLQPDAEQVRSAMHEARFEGILVATLTGASEKPAFAPGVPGGYPDRFWNSYDEPWGYDSRTAADTLYPPGYVWPEELVNFETTVFDAREGDKLVWSVMTRSANPAAGRDFARGFANAVVPAMAKAGLTPR